MRIRFSFFAPCAVVVAMACGGSAQVAVNRVLGEVTSIDVAARKITIKQDSGAAATVSLDDATVYLRVPPGEKDLTKAAKITLADIAPGDRVLARGTPARSVIVMTKADLAKKQEHDRAEWQRRGTAGIVTALDSERKEITLQTQSREGLKPVVVEGAPGVVFRRYAPGSVRFADAKPSSFSELKVGDHLRVLGDKNAEGTRIKPEEIVSGSFRNFAGTVVAVDAAGGEIRLTDLETKKPVTVRINADSSLRRVPPMMAMMLARRRQAAQDGAAAGRGAPAGTAPGPANGARMGGHAGPGFNRSVDFQEMLDRMPALSPQELKRGDAVIVSSTAGEESSQVTAIVLLAGVEPLLTAPAPRGERPIGGEWNFDIGLP